MRSSPLPSVQYATPRPDPWRGAPSPRLPSSIRHIHSCSPVSGSMRHDSAPHAGLRVHDAVDHQRRHLHVVVGARAVVVGLEPPRDAQVLGVVFVDLVERGVFRAARLAGVRPPFAVRRPVLRRERGDGDDEQTCERKEPARHRASRLSVEGLWRRQAGNQEQ